DQWTPLVQRNIKVFEPREEAGSPRGWLSPMVVFSFLFVVGLAVSIVDFRRKKLTTAFDVILFSVLGMIGLLLTLLWVATDHKAAANNFNLLWALPTHLVAVIAFIRQPRWLEKYFLLTAMISTVLLITWPLLPQQLNVALVPIVMTVVVRAIAQYFVRSRSTL
ncbi:MAG TPA: hypothetical protein VEB86_16420, partial [Chryseosolibacter sp.]|nr:hypothetical protein [Chryseosolibacter sp.]